MVHVGKGSCSYVCDDHKHYNMCHVLFRIIFKTKYGTEVEKS